MSRKLFCSAIVLLVVCIPLVARFVYAGGPPGPFDDPPGFENGNQSEKAEEAIDIHKPITPGGYYERLVLVHHAKGGIPGPPDKEEKPKDYDTFALLGLSWPADVLPVEYFIDPDHAPGGSVGEIEDAFEAWDTVTSTVLFDAPVVDSYVGPSVDVPDYMNTVSWRMVVPPRVVAVTFIWYDPKTFEMVDCDVVMNTKQDWGIDPDGEGPERLKGAFDVRNIVTHEAGHVVGLDDLYDEIYSELTMYGYSSKGETKKISLENGDVLGCQALYGE